MTPENRALWLYTFAVLAGLTVVSIMIWEVLP